MDETQIWAMFAVNLIVIIGGVGKGIRLLVSVRDEIRDLNKAVGIKSPPDGLLGDVELLKKNVLQHRDSLIEITAELGLDRPGGRS